MGVDDYHVSVERMEDLKERNKFEWYGKNDVPVISITNYGFYINSAALALFNERPKKVEVGIDRDNRALAIKTSSGVNALELKEALRGYRINCKGLTRYIGHLFNLNVKQSAVRANSIKKGKTGNMVILSFRRF